MANEKQDGSNLINIEYSTGKCPTTCEQCFVNFGQQGAATCLNWSGANYEGPRQYAIAEERAYRKANGGRSIYNPGEPPPKGTKVPAGYELLSWRIPKNSDPGYTYLFWQGR